MSFLGNPCICGWSLDQMNEEDTIRQCEKCGRREEKKVWAMGSYWVVVNGETKGKVQ